MTDLAYQDIERGIVGILPELRAAAEYYWRVEGPPGSDSGPYVFFESMYGAYVTILLAMPNSPKRDEMLRRAFNLIEIMLVRDDETIRDLAFIGLLESRGRGGGSALSRSWDQRRRVRWMRASLGGEERLLARQQTRPNSSTSTVPGPIIARELAEEGISLDHVPGATHMREAN